MRKMIPKSEQENLIKKKHPAIKQRATKKPPSIYRFCLITLSTEKWQFFGCKSPLYYAFQRGSFLAQLIFDLFFWFKKVPEKNCSTRAEFVLLHNPSTASIAGTTVRSTGYKCLFLEGVFPITYSPSQVWGCDRYNIGKRVFVCVCMGDGINFQACFFYLSYTFWIKY